MPSSWSSDGLRHDRFVDVGVEQRAWLADLLQAVALSMARSWPATSSRPAMIWPSSWRAAASSARLMLSMTGSKDSTTASAARRRSCLRVALHALAVVVELRLQAAQVIEVRVAVLGELAELPVLGGVVGVSAACCPRVACLRARPRPPASATFGRAVLRLAASSFECFLSVICVRCSCPGRGRDGALVGAAPAGR